MQNIYVFSCIQKKVEPTQTWADIELEICLELFPEFFGYMEVKSKEKGGRISMILYTFTSASIVVIIYHFVQLFLCHVLFDCWVDILQLAIGQHLF